MEQPIVPQHPGRSEQQGLAPAPAATPAANPYFAPSAALQNYNGNLQAAQAQKANAEASKMNSEADLIRQSQGLGMPAQPVAPTVDPTAELADGIISGQLGSDQLHNMIQAGQLTPQMADAAMGMAQSYMQQQAPQAQQQGLGQI